MKKTAQNDVTGDWIQSKPNSEMFEKNFDLIFRKKEKYNFQNLKETIKENNERIKELPEYQLNKSTGEVEKVEDGDTTNTQK